MSYLRSYYSATYGEMSVTGLDFEVRSKVGQLSDVHFIPTQLLPLSLWKETGEVQEGMFGIHQKSFEGEVQAQGVAVLLTEPIQGDARMVAPPENYFRRLKRILDDY